MKEEGNSLEIRIWGIPMTSEEEKKKKEVFEGMSPRRQQRILKKGYDKWDPFLAPKEPPFFNQEERIRVREAALQLEEFLLHKSREGGRMEPSIPLMFRGRGRSASACPRGKNATRACRISASGYENRHRDPGRGVSLPLEHPVSRVDVGCP